MPSPSRISWTNKSVLQFAGNADPIALIEEKARQLVLRVRDAGWSGPPYNPLAIADFLRIPVEATGDVADARTIATDGGLTIQFNPTQPRERVRFSIAHEIAHSLFSDAAEEVRHRGGRPSSLDEWQLEMLCNIAAAEFVMPLGSLSSTEHLPQIEQLMIDRRKFDVSSEAFLIRVVKTTAEPALMFCSSTSRDESDNASYYVDYSVPSKSSPTTLTAGTRVPRESVIYSCTAIGQTNHATEHWVADSGASVECVGIPAFSGARYPRVAGIVRLRAEDADSDALSFVQGDVLAPIGAGPKVICQLVNDQARVWGGGVARLAARQYQQFSEWFAAIPRRERLGQVHFADLGGETFLASLIAQEGYGASSKPRIRYAALERCFGQVRSFSVARGAVVHLPRIGAGQSGGSWDTVEEIIRDTLIVNRARAIVYDLPPRRQGNETDFLL